MTNEMFRDDMHVRLCHDHCRTSGHMYYAIQVGSEAVAFQSRASCHPTSVRTSMDTGRSFRLLQLAAQTHLTCSEKKSCDDRVVTFVGKEHSSCSYLEIISFQVRWTVTILDATALKPPPPPRSVVCGNGKLLHLFVPVLNFTNHALPYAVYQFGRECWCGVSDTFADYEQNGQGLCHMPCAGDEHTACGKL